MARGSEIEIKMRLDPNEAESFATLGLLRSAKPTRSQLRTVYFDDDRRRLQEKGVELRVRRDGGNHVQTVKVGRGLKRGEWEAPVSNDTPEPDAVRGTPAQKFIGKHADLKSIFVVEVERRVWLIEKDGGRAEISLDCGEVKAEQRRQAIAEAEIELKAGSPRLLFDLARKAIHDCDAPPSFVGKALRGRRLAQGADEKTQRSLDLALSPKMTATVAFQSIVDACLVQVSLNEELLRRRPGDVEATHQLRVAVRRLRAALTLFAPMIAGASLDGPKANLKWISNLLGEARDLDVFETKLIAKTRAAHPDLQGLDKLRSRCEALRTSAHDALDEALRSERFACCC